MITRRCLPHVRPGLYLAISLCLGTVGSLFGAALDPVLKSQWPGYRRDRADAVVVSGHYAYVAAGDLQIIDLSDPANPQLAGAYNVSGDKTLAVAAAGNYAYVVGRATYDPTTKEHSGGGLQVIDVSNPADPRRVGDCAGGSSASGVAVSGNYAYVAAGSAGLQIIDISVPARPQLVGGYGTKWSASAVAVSANHAYVASWCLDSGWQLQSFDISNPTEPRQVGSLKTSGTVSGLAVSENHSFLAAGWAGLQVIDIGNPAKPQSAGVCAITGANAVAVLGNYAYVADSVDGLLVIDITDPTHPQRLGGYSANGSGVTVSGNHAYLAAYTGLQVIDVTIPAKPTWVGGYGTSSVDALGEAGGVAVSGSHACLADGLFGLQVIDISDPDPSAKAGRSQHKRGCR